MTSTLLVRQPFTYQNTQVLFYALTTPQKTSKSFKKGGGGSVAYAQE